MTSRRPIAFVFLGIFASLGASYRTTTANFVVEAPTPQIAQQVGEFAERYRKEKAMLWLGYEMPAWGERCPLQVSVQPNGAGGATSFAFDNGAILNQNMHIEGSLDRLLASVLPHEVTHTVFAFYFRTPVPRWADEGGAVLSEDELEKSRHDMLVRQILNSGHAIPLRRLFGLREYPSDVMALYAEGFSVSDFLVSSSNRPTFLNFVATGMREGWDRAAQNYYHYRSVEELEQAWLNHLKETRRNPTMLAQNTNPGSGTSGNHMVVRQTAPPAQPLLEVPRVIYRGQAPGAEGDSPEDRKRSSSAALPQYLPEYVPASRSALQTSPTTPPGGWQRAPADFALPGARLGPPQPLATPPSTPPGQPTGTVSPAGYPL